MKQSTLFLKGILLLSMNTVLLVLLAWLLLMIIGLIMQVSGEGHLFVATLNSAMNELLTYLIPFPQVLAKQDALLQLLSLPNIDMPSLMSNGITTINQSSVFDFVMPTLHIYLAIIILATHFMILKAVTLMSMFWLLVWLVFIIFFDGLIARSLRRFRGERESALIYHQSKRLAAITYYITVLFFLVSPLNIAPNVVLVSGFLVINIFVWLATKQFKKYL